MSTKTETTASKVQTATNGGDPPTQNETKPPIPSTDVPDSAKRAAARNTADDMASIPEAEPAPAPVAETPTASRKPKKGRAASPPKATEKAAPKKSAAPARGSLQDIGDAWLESLRAAGHTASTVSSYGNDLAIAYEHFGDTKKGGEITEKEIAAFNTSKGVVKKANGKPKAKPPILKTRRALRLALVWAAGKGLVKKAPFETKTPG